MGHPSAHQNCLAGFRGSAREDIRRLAELLGMEFNGALVNDRTTHLILASEALLCQDIPRSQKLDSAKCWGIALTHYAWLKDSLAMGKILDAQKYIVQVRGLLKRENSMVAAQVTHALSRSPTEQPRPACLAWERSIFRCLDTRTAKSSPDSSCTAV